jgi:hypothetical protein
MSCCENVKLIRFNDNQSAERVGTDELGPIWKLRSVNSDEIGVFHDYNDLLDYRYEQVRKECKRIL